MYTHVCGRCAPDGEHEVFRLGVGDVEQRHDVLIGDRQEMPGATPLLRDQGGGLRFSPGSCVAQAIEVGVERAGSGLEGCNTASRMKASASCGCRCTGVGSSHASSTPMRAQPWTCDGESTRTPTLCQKAPQNDMPP